MNRTEFLSRIDATPEILSDKNDADDRYRCADSISDLLERVSDYEASHPGTVEILVCTGNATFQGRKPHYNGYTLYMLLIAQDGKEIPIMMEPGKIVWFTCEVKSA